MSDTLSELLKNATRTDAVPPQSSGKPVTDLPPFARAGFELAKFVLWIIVFATAFLLILIALEEFINTGTDHSSMAIILNKLSTQSPDIANAPQIEAYQKLIDSTKLLLSQIDNEKQNTRDFMIKLSQLILISILLPVLTALLGYIFGTHQSVGQNESKNA